MTEQQISVRELSRWMFVSDWNSKLEPATALSAGRAEPWPELQRCCQLREMSRFYSQVPSNIIALELSDSVPCSSCLLLIIWHACSKCSLKIMRSELWPCVCMWTGMWLPHGPLSLCFLHQRGISSSLAYIIISPLWVLRTRQLQSAACITAGWVSTAGCPGAVSKQLLHFSVRTRLWPAQSNCVSCKCSDLFISDQIFLDRSRRYLLLT